MKKKLVSHSENDTEKIAEEFTQYLKAGDVIFLIGDLGSGKTTFVRAVAKALGIKSRILSPTFSLIRSHNVPTHQKIKKLHHVDLYRSHDADDTVEEILKEFQNEKDGVIFIEWPKEELNFKANWRINFSENKDSKIIDIEEHLD